MSLISLSMAGYKPINGAEHARRFFQILERAGGIYIPEYMGARTRYVPYQFDRLTRDWMERGFVLLKRRRPVSVKTVMTPDLRQSGGWDLANRLGRPLMGAYRFQVCTLTPPTSPHRTRVSRG